MGISGEGWSASQGDDGVVSLAGSMRLSTREYLDIKEFILAAAEGADEQLVLDLRGLEFLNSSGINMLYQVALALKDRAELVLQVLGSREVGWQAKTLANLRRFAPSSELAWS